MNQSENRKITAYVSCDRDSLERKNLRALLCVVFYFIILFSTVTILVLFLNVPAQAFYFKNELFLKVREKRHRGTTDLILIIISVKKLFFSPL